MSTRLNEVSKPNVCSSVKQVQKNKEIVRTISVTEWQKSDTNISELQVNEEIKFYIEPKDENDDELFVASLYRRSKQIWILCEISSLGWKVLEDDFEKETKIKVCGLLKRNKNYDLSTDGVNMQIQINKVCSFKEVFKLWAKINGDYLEYLDYVLDLKIPIKQVQRIEEVLPIYERAKNYIVLELRSYANEIKKEQCNIIEVSGRTKNIDSIQEKVHRKKILFTQIIEKFDDIAGVRVVCEYLSDVYSVLEYIKDNPQIKVLEIDDKIENPTIEGYRGIHVITDVDVYYNMELHRGIKVEIQIRTSFQNAWAMKTHNLTYKRESELDANVTEQMKELSDFLYSADKKANELKDLACRCRLY